jgi:excisionase family DNA binding protein
MRVSDVARALSVSRSQAYSLVGAAVIPSIRVGSSIRVSRRELEQWIERRSAEARSTASLDTAGDVASSKGG